MEERDPEATDWSDHEIASEVSERVRSVIAAAEAAASAIRHDADEHAQARRRQAEADARQLLDDARRDAEALLAERIQRISALSDTIIARGEKVLDRIGRAEEVRRELEALVDALGESAGELAREARAEVRPPAAANGGTSGAGDSPQPSEPSATSAVADDAQTEAGTEQRAADAEVAVEPPVETVAPDAGESAADQPADVEAVGADGDREASPGVAEQEHQDRSNGNDAAEVVTVEGSAVEEAAGEGDDQLLGARLVALQMAVAGGNRGEVEAHLRRAFSLVDSEEILDDVFGAGTDASKRVVWPSPADG